MKTKKFWTPIIASLAVTPVVLILSIGSAGVGHGDYFWAMIFFPYTMPSALVFDEITVPFIVLAILQFPLYGMMLAFAAERRSFLLSAIGLAVVHILAVALMLALR